MSDLQKANEIGKLVAESCDDPLTVRDLVKISLLLWPESGACRAMFCSSYVQTMGSEDEKQP